MLPSACSFFEQETEEIGEDRKSRGVNAVHDRRLCPQHKFFFGANLVSTPCHIIVKQPTRGYDFKSITAPAACQTHHRRYSCPRLEMLTWNASEYCQVCKESVSSFNERWRMANRLVNDGKTCSLPFAELMDPRHRVYSEK